jgi:hypothetical protein
VYVFWQSIMIRVEALSAGGSAVSPLAARKVIGSATAVSSHDVGQVRRQ